MEFREYYKKWLDKKDSKLSYSFFDAFNQKDWDEFWEDFFNGHEYQYIRIFNFSKHYRLDEYIIPYFKNLSVNALKLINNSLVNILARAIKENHIIIISQVLDIISYFDLNVSINNLISVINNADIDEDTKINAVLILNQTDNRKVFWNKIDITKDKFLIPFFMSFHQDLEPYRSLQILSIFKEIPKNISEFEIPVKNSLISLLKYPTDIKKFQDLLETSNKWYKKYIKDFMESYDELSLIKYRLCEIKETIIIIRLGLSVYPDFVFIEMLVKYMREFGINLIITYYPWNKLYYALNKNKVDLIITNREILEGMNSDIEKYRKLKKFNQYEGFAIVLKNKNAIVYEDFKNKNIEFDSKALNIVMSQLNNKKIFASKNTDHRIQLIELLTKINSKIKISLNRNNKEPYEGFKDFLNLDSYDAFIGAAIHTQLLKRRKKIKVILDEATHDFGAKQYNVFAVLKDNSKLSEVSLTKFFSALRQCKNNIDLEVKSNVKILYKLFNKKLKEVYRADYKLYRLTFKEFEDVIKVMDFDFDAMDEIKKLVRKGESKDMMYLDFSNQLAEIIKHQNQKAVPKELKIQEQLDFIIKKLENQNNFLFAIWDKLSFDVQKELLSSHEKKLTPEEKAELSSKMN